MRDWSPPQRLTAHGRFIGEERVNLSLQEKPKKVNSEKGNFVVPHHLKKVHIRASFVSFCVAASFIF